MHSLTLFKKLRGQLIVARVTYLNKLWKMNIDPTARLSFSARLDKTHPKGIHIGPESYIAFGATILTHDMTRGLYVDTRIGRRCFIGAHSIILPGVTVGDESIVGAGSVVTKDVPPRCIVAGNPAKVVRENIEVVASGRLKEADENEKRCLTQFYEEQEEKKMRNVSTILLVLATGFSLALGACAMPGGASMHAPSVLDKEQTTMLRPGDTLKISVYGEETLTDDNFVIDSAGMVTVPLVGSIPAAGRTKETLQQEIAEILVADQFLSEPHVTVDVGAARPVSILGEVKKPGAFPFEPGMDAFKAVAAAEGYTPRAAKNKLLIDRIVGGTRIKMYADESTPLLPGDAITVRERLF